MFLWLIWTQLTSHGKQATEVSCAVVPHLYDQFILTADVIDRLSRCNANVNQAQVGSINYFVNSPASVDNCSRVDDEVTALSSPMLTVM